MAGWQTKCGDLMERGRYLLNNELLTDCTFLVGSDENKITIKGHKFLLTISSPVFETMFFGSIPEINDPIPILDVQPEDFKTLFEYIYTNSATFSSYDRACKVYYAAKKYMLPYLCEMCVNYLDECIHVMNVCYIYEFAKLFEETDLKNKCIKLIETKTGDVLANGNFMECQIETVIDIFQNNELKIYEMGLFNAAVCYSHVLKVQQKPQEDELIEKMEDLSCNIFSTQTSPINSGLTIRDVIRNIRFLRFTAQQFAEGPALSNLLTTDEALSIMINISSSREGDCQMPAGFSTSRDPRGM